ncbi:MAG: hypothetical protein FWG33_00905 [Oscillospiraceae bacterium]|nr:hypothetical protein [Oscillospiraceae bacterium]
MRNNISFKKRMLSKRGSVLFIVLVIMSFMVVLASAVYYAVQNGRQNVVMDYSDSQAFQTANDVLTAMDKFLIAYDPTTSTANAKDVENLNSAIAKLRTNCGLRYVPPMSNPVPEDCEEGTPSKLCKFVDHGKKTGGTTTISCGAAIWRQNPEATLDGLMNGYTKTDGTVVPVQFVEGEHYLQSKTATASALGGGGDRIDILIFVNRHGDIVMQVTVEYNGRLVTTSRFYDIGEQRAFAPKWLSPEIKDGYGLHWEWVSPKNPKPIGDPKWDSPPGSVDSKRVISGQFLNGKCYVEDSKDGWAQRDYARICRSKDCVDPTADVCPGGATDKNGNSVPYCFDVNNPRTYPKSDTDPNISPTNPYIHSKRGELIGGCHPTSWEACHIGEGWWVWIENNSPPATNPLPFFPASSPWITTGSATDANFLWSTDCSDAVFNGTNCACLPAPQGTKWKIGRLDGWPPGVTPDTTTVTRCSICHGIISPVPADPADGCICDEEELSGDPLTFETPGGSWKQNAAFHMTGSDCKRPASWTPNAPTTCDCYTIKGNLGTTAPLFHKTCWTILDNNNNTFAFGDVITAGNLVFNDVQFYNRRSADPTTGITAPLTITVGGNMYISCPTGNITGFPSGARLHSNPSSSGRFLNGPIHVVVRGDLHFGAASNNVIDNAAKNKVTFWYGGNLIGNVPNGATAIKLLPGMQEYDDMMVSITQKPGLAQWDFGNPLPWAGVPTVDINWTLAVNNRGHWNKPLGVGGADTAKHLLDTYGINTSGVEDRIFYIDRSCTVTTNRDNRDHSIRMILIDTGVGEQARTISLHLSSTGRFRWLTEGEAKLAILTLGDGNVVLNVPNGYETVQNGGRSIIAPFNLMVNANTNNSGWMTSGNFRVGNSTKDPFSGDGLNATRQCGQNGGGCWNAVCTNTGYSGCALIRLLDAEGGLISADEMRAKNILIDDNASGTGFRQRGHAEPINMNIYLVYNGEAGTEADDQIRFREHSFFAGTVFAPTMVFRQPSSGQESVLMFGTLYVSRLNTNTQAFLISMLPGKKRDTYPDYDEETYSPQSPAGIDTTNSGSGNGMFDDLEGVGSGDGKSKH